MSRRRVAQGAAWALPAVMVSAAAPTVAASLTLCQFTVALTSSSTVSNPMILNATSPGSSKTYTVQIASTLGPCTETSQNGQNFNMTRGGTAWGGGSNGCGTNDATFSNSTIIPPGAIVLNQRSPYSTTTCLPSCTQSPSQTLVFQFLDGATAFTPTDLTMTVRDITAGGTGWRQSHWDAVGFSVTPTSIGHNPACVDQGAGAGTLTDPFHRAAGTLQGSQVCAFADTFSFASFPSGSQMVYSNIGGRQGWQFIDISSITFTAPC